MERNTNKHTLQNYVYPYMYVDGRVKLLSSVQKENKCKDCSLGSCDEPYSILESLTYFLLKVVYCFKREKKNNSYTYKSK